MFVSVTVGVDPAKFAYCSAALSAWWFLDIGWTGPAGQMYSSANDMLKFLAFLVRYLPPDLSRGPSFDRPPHLVAYQCGWFFFWGGGGGVVAIR